MFISTLFKCTPAVLQKKSGDRREEQMSIVDNVIHMGADVLLIHIPKTAGTSVRHLLIQHGVNYKELHFNSRMQCAPWKYLDWILDHPEQKVILTWRDPVEHVRSTFHFYQEYRHFGYPTEFSEFIEHPQLQNQQAAFLIKEHFLSAPDLVSSPTILDKIRELIDRPNTFCFLQDYFHASSIRLAQFLGWSQQSQPTTTKEEVRRFNFNKPPANLKNQLAQGADTQSAVLEKIRELNAIDIELYRYMVNRFYRDAAPDESPSLPSYVPVEYPLNLVAGRVTIEKYREELKTIHAELQAEKSVKIADYVRRWLEKFSKVLSPSPAVDVSDDCISLKSLEDLEALFQNDKSEKIQIKTTSF